MSAAGRHTANAIACALAAIVVTASTARGGGLPPELRTVEARGRWGVVAANTREAADAGAAVLRAGGNAADAAVATALTLGVSEAEASGLGGSAWILVHMADGREAAIDGSASVPAAVRPDELRELQRDEVAFGYKMVATPGGLAALAQLLQGFGTKPFAEVAAPAIAVAESGVRLTPHQLAISRTWGWKLAGSRELAGIFLASSLSPWPPDHVYCFDEMGRTLRRLAALGPRDFYFGGVADAISADMKAHGGYVRKSDLVQLRPTLRHPARGRYRGCDVVSFLFPVGGGAVIEALQILDRFPPEKLARHGADRSMLLIEAVRIALYDQYAGWEGGPVEQMRLLDPQHAARRAAQIDLRRALRPGDILGRELVPLRQEGSTHLSVIDREGNSVAVSMTFNHEFGAAVATPGLGFPYNATLALYDASDPASIVYPRPGTLLPNTAAPTILFRDGKPILVLGGPGSGRITSSLVETIVNVIDRGMSVADAVSAPRVLWDGGSDLKVYVEMGGPHTDAEVAELHRRGFPNIYTLRFPPRPIDLLAFGGVNVVGLDPFTGDTVGAGDPRRAGTAVAASR